MPYADEQAYEDMIATLDSYVKKVEEQCGVMSAAATDCVDNTDGDPAAASSAAKLNDNIAKIGEATDDINKVIAALKDELGRIREAARRAEAGN